MSIVVSGQEVGPELINNLARKPLIYAPESINNKEKQEVKAFIGYEGNDMTSFHPFMSLQRHTPVL